ncbi:hypothetical protein [Streptomyces mirabilis]
MADERFTPGARVLGLVRVGRHRSLGGRTKIATGWQGYKGLF